MRIQFEVFQRFPSLFQSLSEPKDSQASLEKLENSSGSVPTFSERLDVREAVWSSFASLLPCLDLIRAITSVTASIKSRIAIAQSLGQGHASRRHPPAWGNAGELPRISQIYQACSTPGTPPAGRERHEQNPLGATENRTNFLMGYSLTTRKSVVEWGCMGQQAFSGG